MVTGTLRFYAFALYTEPCTSCTSGSCSKAIDRVLLSSLDALGPPEATGSCTAASISCGPNVSTPLTATVSWPPPWTHDLRRRDDAVVSPAPTTKAPDAAGETTGQAHRAVLAALLGPAAIAEVAGQRLWALDARTTDAGGFAYMSQPRVASDGTVHLVTGSLYAISPEGDILWPASSRRVPRTRGGGSGRPRPPMEGFDFEAPRRTHESAS